MSDHREPTSQELAVSLAANAAGKPLNLAVGVVVLVIALVAGAPAIVAVVVAVVLYTVAVGRTMFDASEAERVTAKHHRAPPPDDA